MPIEHEQTQKKTIAPKEFHANDNLQSLFVDYVRVASRKDGMYLIRCAVNLPEGIYEQARFLTDTKHFQRMIDTLCQSSKYYPKPKESAVPEVSTSKNDLTV
jgi:hypothetical protein